MYSHVFRWKLYIETLNIENSEHSIALPLTHCIALTQNIENSWLLCASIFSAMQPCQPAILANVRNLGISLR